MKKCSKCEGIFDEIYFPKSKRTKSGLKSECKKCHCNYDRKNRRKGYSNTDEYFKSKLVRSGFIISDINDNKSLVEVKKQLLILKRTIKWSSLKM